MTSFDAFLLANQPRTWEEQLSNPMDEDEQGTCDTCGATYATHSREGRCGNCGNCADHCDHQESDK